MSDFLAEPADVNLYGVALNLGTELEQRILELASGHDDPWMSSKPREDGPLSRRQVESAAVDARGTTCVVNTKRSNHNQGIGIADIAAGDGGHAGDEFAEVERLDQIVVRASIEAFNACRQLVHRGEDDDRHRVAGLAERPQKAKPVAVGQIEIEQHEIVRGRVARLDRAGYARHP